MEQSAATPARVNVLRFNATTAITYDYNDVVRIALHDSVPRTTKLLPHLRGAGVLLLGIRRSLPNLFLVEFPQELYNAPASRKSNTF
jgi:hypothetical protein